VLLHARYAAGLDGFIFRLGALPCRRKADAILSAVLVLGSGDATTGH